MHTFCSICGKKLRDEKPYEDQRNVPRMCPDCTKNQDQILAELTEKRKRISKYLLEGGTKPQE